MPSTYKTRRIYEGEGIEIREVIVLEERKEEYKELFRAFHSFGEGDKKTSTTLRISERESDGRLFLTLFRDDARITISLTKQEIAELFAVLQAYINKRFY